MGDKIIKLGVDKSEVDAATSSVNNFSKSIDGAMQNTGAMNSKLGSMWQSFKSGSDIAVKSLTTVKGAIAATGIGVLLIAVTALVNYFKNTAEGANKMKEVMAALGIVIRDGPIVVIKGLKVILDALILPWQTVISIWKNGVKVLTGKESLTDAVKDVTNGIKEHIKIIGEDAKATADAAKALVEHTKQGFEIAKQEAELHKRQRAEAIEMQDLNNKIAALREKAAEEGITATEKQKLYNEAIADENKLFKIKKSDAQEELNIIKEKIANGDKSTDILDEQKEATIKLMETEEEHSRATRTLQKAETSAFKAENAEKNRIKKEEEKVAEEEAKRLKKYKDDALEDSLSGRAKDLQSLEDWKEDELNIEGTTNEEKIAIEAAYQAKKKGINDKFDAEDFKKKEAATLKEISMFKGTVDQELELLNNALKDKLISQEEYEKEVDKINKEKEQASQFLLQSEGEKFSAHQQKQLDTLNAYLAKGLITEKQYAEAKKQLKKQEVDYTLNATQQTLDMVSEAAGKGTILGKATAIASIGINTAKGIMAAWASSEEFGPILGPILAAIQTAALVVMGGKQIASIASVQPPEKQSLSKKEYGGFISGPSHANGGVPILAEGGEIMMSNMAVARNPHIADMVLNANQSSMAGGSAKSLGETDIARIAASVVKTIPVNINETDRMIEQRRIAVRENIFTV